MKLFLSSQNFGNYPEVFINMVGKGAKVAFIENAKDADDPETRQARKEVHTKELTELGFVPEEIDLRDYFGKEKELKEKISQFAGLFVYGGNVFILRRAMAASGFDNILKELVPAGKLVYGGSSAGSCVAAKDLHGIDRGDRPEPKHVPENYPIKDIIWDGLGFIDFMIVPHYKSPEHFETELMDKCVEYLEQNNLPFKALSDGQVYIMDGEKQVLLG